MKSYELLREVSAHLGIKCVAAELKVSPQLFRKWTVPTGVAHDGRVNPLDRIAALQKITKTKRLAEWICQEAGGYYVKNPAGRKLHKELMPAHAEVLGEVAHLLGTLSTATKNGAVSDAEARDIRKRADELKSVLEGFVKECERGDFRCLPMPALQLNATVPATKSSRGQARA